MWDNFLNDENIFLDIGGNFNYKIRKFLLERNHLIHREKRFSKSIQSLNFLSKIKICIKKYCNYFYFRISKLLKKAISWTYFYFTFIIRINISRHQKLTHTFINISNITRIKLSASKIYRMYLIIRFTR